MRIRTDKGIKILAAMLICTVLASCGSPVNREPQTDGDTAAGYVQEKAGNDGTDDVSVKNMPYIEQIGYASENGGTLYECEIDRNKDYSFEDNKIILTPLHE